MLIACVGALDATVRRMLRRPRDSTMPTGLYLALSAFFVDCPDLFKFAFSVRSFRF
jgi:hypothetical protein